MAGVEQLSMLCIPDSDFLISMIKKDDVNHQVTLNIYEMLKNEDARIIYPITAIIEAATALLRRYGLPETTKALLEIYQNPQITVIDIKQSEFIESVQYFNPKASKHHTPFDCLILALAKQYHADIILSFDKFYKNKGFKVAPDLA